MPKCKHGLDERFCAPCQELKAAVSSPQNTSSRLQRPQHQRSRTSSNGDTYPTPLGGMGHVVVHTPGGRNHHSFRNLGERTRFVHIDGHPHLWTIKMILELAPSLETIRVTPTISPRLHTQSHLRLCQERGVRVTTGYDRPNQAWAGEGTRDPQYAKRRLWLSQLSGEQKALFEELLDMGFQTAEMAARYYCLEGEEFIPQRVLGEQYGYSPRDLHYISAHINAVLHYLDSGIEVSEPARQIASTMRKHVEYLRPVRASAAERQRIAEELGLPYLPQKLPLALLDRYRVLLEACRDGRLAALAQKHEHAYRALALRYGLDTLDLPEFRRLEEVGQLLGEVSRQRVHQLEQAALEQLGIEMGE